MGASTDIVSSIDTTGVSPGPHAKLEGVTPVFDKEREAQGYDEERDITDEERWAEKALGGASEAYQAEQAAADESNEDESGDDKEPVEGGIESILPDPADVEPGLDYAAQTGSLDTSETDTQPASTHNHETLEGKATDVLDTSATGGEPSDGPEGNVNATSELTGPESSTAVASDPKTDADSANKVDGDPIGPEYKAWDEGFKVTELLKVAKDKKIEVPSGSSKGEIIALLIKQGVKPPAADDAQSGASAV